jgi:branched-chain amino acid transport system permease protein
VNWVDALVQGVLVGGRYALFAAGLSLMFGVMRIVNLAHGALAVVGAYVASELILRLDLPLWAAMLVALPVMGALGYLLQRFLLDRTMSSGEFVTPLVTFALAIVLSNLLFVLFTSDVRSISAGNLSTASIQLPGGITVSLIGLIVFLLALLILGGLQLFLNRTQTGRIVRATADSGATARLMGINARRVFHFVTAFALVTATIAGVATGIQSNFDPNTGTVLLLFAFETVVIGGLGSLWGTVLGGTVLGVAQTLAAQVDVQYALLAGHLVFLVFLFVRPRGLFPGTWQG